MTNTKTLSLLNLISFILMLAVNALATFNLLGASTKQISDSNPSLLMPIGFTFSVVWTLIYLLLIIYTVYQLLNPTKVVVRRIGILYFLTNILNILWILSYHTRLNLLSNIVIIGLFITLFIIVRRLDDANMLTKVTFSIYYAWITVATVVSIFAYISSFNPSNFDSTALRIGVGIIALLMMILTFIRNDDYAYVGTIVFAMIGILLKHIIDFKTMYPEIIAVLIVALIMIIVVFTVSIINRNGFYEDDDLAKRGTF